MSEILLTGGIGDIFALESHLDFTPVKKIYWATRVAHTMLRLFPNVEHEILINDFSKRFDYFNKSSVEKAIGHMLPADDWSIETQFPKLPPYHGSSFLKTKPKPIINKDYVVVCPYSTDRPRFTQGI